MASLALNVLIIGTVAGTLCFSRFGHDQHGGGFKKSALLLHFARTLPRERADMIRQKFADAQPNMEALRKGIRDARASVREALMAETFDQAKFNAALDGVVQAETNVARARTTLFGESVGQLTPEERRQLHEWLDKKRPLR
ncbi:MAG: periplasmic heavy metal sensor [Hyphomicrobium sp.]